MFLVTVLDCSSCLTYFFSISSSPPDCSFLRVVDRFNALLVSAFITPGGTVFLLLHNGRTVEDNVRAFFVEVSDLYAKHVMNPFAVLGAPMTLTNGCSPAFDVAVRNIAQRTLHGSS